MDFFAIVISVLTSIGVFTLKLRSIAQKDIKSDKLKIALIKANLYFNADGKLVKKTEKMVGRDIDGDGKISDEPVKEDITTGFFSGIATAASEFHTIVTADLSNEEDYEKTLKEANLEKSEEGLNEITDAVSRGTKAMVIDGIEREVERKESKTKKDKTLSEAEKVQKENLFVRLKNMLRRKKKEILETNETKEDVVVNNVEVDAVVKETKKTKKKASEVIEEVTVKEEVKTVVKKKTSANTGTKKADDILASLLK